MTSSYVICTKDRTQDLQNCLQSVGTQTVLPEEVIIVDASSDDIYTFNRENCKRILEDKIKLVHLESEPSTTKQRNKGIDNAQGDIVFFLDDDVVLERKYHESMLDVYQLKKDQDIGGVRGSYTSYNYLTRKHSWIEAFFRKIFLLRRDIMTGKSCTLPSLNAIEVLKPDEIIEVEFMPSCICSYYRKILKEYKFDEILDKYALAEDWDLSYRVSRKYTLYQTPYALLTHYFSPVSRLKMKEFRKKQIVHSNYFAKKYIRSKSSQWIAFYWSMVGRFLFVVIRSCKTFNYDEVVGFFDGFKSSIILKGNRAGKS